MNVPNPTFAVPGLARLATLTVVAALLCAAPAVSAMEGDAEEATDQMMSHRIDLPTLSTATPFPYTVEVPATWEPRREIAAAGVFVGPPGIQPETNPETIFVRHSNVDVSDPEAVVESIRTTADSQPWDALEVEVFEADGQRGVWVLMQIPGTGTKPARRTLTVKMPADEGSMDVMATAPVDRFEELQPRFERILRSIRPASEEASAEGSDEGGAE